MALPTTPTELDATARDAENQPVPGVFGGGPRSTDARALQLTGVPLPATGVGSDLSATITGPAMAPTGTGVTTDAGVDNHPLNAYYNDIGDNGVVFLAVRETKASPQGALLRLTQGTTAPRVIVAAAVAAFDV